jgi:hypothetical protein
LRTRFSTKERQVLMTCKHVTEPDSKIVFYYCLKIKDNEIEKTIGR